MWTDLIGNLCLYQITYSNVVNMVDYILNSSCQVTVSADGKKKKKLAENHKSNLPNNVVYRGGSALSFLSSLLDVLLLKKDITKRFITFHAN